MWGLPKRRNGQSATTTLKWFIQNDFYRLYRSRQPNGQYIMYKIESTYSK